MQRFESVLSLIRSTQLYDLKRNFGEANPNNLLTVQDMTE